MKDSIKVIEKEFIKNTENKNTISLVLARQKDEKTQYNSFLFSETEIKGIMTIFAVTNGGYETIEEAKKGMEEAKFESVNQELFFSEEYSKIVYPTLKSMEDITKEDYIKVVKYVRSFEKEIIAFAAQEEKDSKSSAEYAIRKFSKKLAQKKLFFLGYYNPYGFQNSDYFKKFEGDKDIEELNNVETEINF